MTGSEFDITNIINESSNAIIALPSEFKTIFLISLAIFIGISIIKKAWKFAKILGFVTIIWIALTYFGLI